MSEDRRRILEMLAEGKITAAEADRLIEAAGEMGPDAKQSTNAEIISQVSQLTAVLDSPETHQNLPDHKEDTFSVGPSPKLEVQSFNGRIELKAGPDDQIRVRASFKQPSRIEYESVKDGDTVRITAKKWG